MTDPNGGLEASDADDKLAESEADQARTNVLRAHEELQEAEGCIRAALDLLSAVPTLESSAGRVHVIETSVSSLLEELDDALERLLYEPGPGDWP